MKVIETFSDFVSAVANYSEYEAPKDWRRGQSAYNLLMKVRPDVALLLNGSDFDPFYRDDRLPLFYDFVMRHW